MLDCLRQQQIYKSQSTCNLDRNERIHMQGLQSTPNLQRGVRKAWCNCTIYCGGGGREVPYSTFMRHKKV